MESVSLMGCYRAGPISKVKADTLHTGLCTQLCQAHVQRGEERLLAMGGHTVSDAQHTALWVSPRCG